MADKEGAVVAMDPRTGEILAMVSRPTFDPNDFAVRIPSAEWQSLNYGSADAAAEPRHPGAACPGLGLQDCHGHGDARVQGSPGEFHGVLPRTR